MEIIIKALFFNVVNIHNVLKITVYSFFKNRFQTGQADRMITYAVFASMKIIAVEQEIILYVLKQGFPYQKQLVLEPSYQDQDHENFGISSQTGSGPITIGKFRTYSDRHDRTDYRSYLAIFIAKFAVIFPLWSSHPNSPSYYHPISHLNARLI